MIKDFKLNNSGLTYLIAVAANLVLQLFAAIIAQSFLIDAENTYFNFIFMLCIQIAFCFVYYYLTHKNSKGLTINTTNKPHTASFFLAAALGVICILAFYPATYFFSWLLTKTGYEIQAISQMTSPGEYVLGLFVILIAAPIGEELIMRSALLSGLIKIYKAPVAVLLTAVSFMLMHMSPSQTVYQFALAIVIGFAAVFTGSVFIASIIHSISNLMAFLIDYTHLGTLLNDFILLLEQNPVWGVFTAIGFTVFFSVLIFFILKLMKKIEKGKARKPVLAVNTADSVKNIANDPPYSLEEEHKELNSEDESKKRQILLFEKKSFKMIYLLAIGICAFMWIVGLIAGIMA